MLLLHLLGPEFEPYRRLEDFFMFFNQILTLKGSNLGQKSQFFRSLPQPWDHPFYIRFLKIYMYCKGQVPESTGSRSKNHFCRVFFNKKMPNFELFLNRSFKLKETLIVVYTHEYLWETTIKSLPELSACISKFSAYVFHYEQKHFWIPKWSILNLLIAKHGIFS